MWLVLAEAVESRHDARADEVNPDPTPRSFIGVCRVQILSIFSFICVDFIQVFADDTALVERLGLFAAVDGTAQRRHEATWVEFQKGGGLVVGIYFDVLVGDAFFFEDEPGALHEGAEPAGVELERVVGAVGADQ